MINFIPKFGEFLCYNQNIKHKVKKRALNIHLFSDSYLVSGAAVWAELLTPTLRGHHLQEDPQVDIPEIPHLAYGSHPGQIPPQP